MDGTLLLQNWMGAVQLNDEAEECDQHAKKTKETTMHKMCNWLLFDAKKQVVHLGLTANQVGLKQSKDLVIQHCIADAVWLEERRRRKEVERIVHFLGDDWFLVHYADLDSSDETPFPVARRDDALSGSKVKWLRAQSTCQVRRS